MKGGNGLSKTEDINSLECFFYTYQQEIRVLRTQTCRLLQKCPDTRLAESAAVQQTLGSSPSQAVSYQLFAPQTAEKCSLDS